RRACVSGCARYERSGRNVFSVRRLYAGGLHASRDARDESIRGAGRLARDDARGDDARLWMGTVGGEIPDVVSPRDRPRNRPDEMKLGAWRKPRARFASPISAIV